VNDFVSQANHVAVITQSQTSPSSFLLSDNRISSAVKPNNHDQTGVPTQVSHVVPSHNWNVNQGTLTVASDLS
jgi:hypothetical protein